MGGQRYTRGVLRQVKKRQKEKLQRLLSEKMKIKTQSLQDKPDAETVVNCSSRSLMKHEHEVLSLGLNFAFPPQQLPVSELITSTEEAA